MMDQPSIRELVTAVRDFLETRAMPELKGHTAFHARVAANALSIVARQLEFYGHASDEETKRLAALLGHEGALDELNRELCARIPLVNSRFRRLDSPRISKRRRATRSPSTNRTIRD
jgi:hypothetical protein